MTRYSGQDQPAKVQPPDRPAVAPVPPPPSGFDSEQPRGILEAAGELSEDAMRQIRDRFAAALGQPPHLYPIAPYEVTIERPRRRWWRKLFILPPRRDPR